MAADVAAPALTVVVPAVNSWADLDGCLAALEAERVDTTLEVLVVNRLGPALAAQVTARYPWVRLLPATTETTIPQMRAQAFAVASGSAVAVIEDHVLVPRGWAGRMLACLDAGEDVVGGAVENAATETLMDWAAFLCEYSQLLPPLPSGPVGGITGNNTIYRRTVLAGYESAWRAGRWENYLHDAMRAGGVTLMQHPEIVVGHKKHYTFWEYTSQRYLYSRSYAGARLLGAPLARRLFTGCAAFALPPLIYWRVVSAVWKKGQHRGHLLRSLPLLVPFVCAYAVGEILGYWFGPGDALQQVT